MRHKLTTLSVAAFMALAVSVVCCKPTSSGDGLAAERIPFHEMSIKSYGDLPSGFFAGMEYVVLSSSDPDYLISSIDKVVFKDGLFYILDWSKKRILAFGEDGSPSMRLAKSGRGPGEYLQITDFDVDIDGSVWVWDGQNDRILHYGADCSFLGMAKPEYDIRLMKCIGADRFLFELASWDKSECSGYELLLSDRELGSGEAFVEYGENIDMNYELLSMGFSDNGESICYHQPIDDYVYEIIDGRPQKKYYFDFGRKSVPDDYKKDVEKHLEDLALCTTLMKTVYVDSSYAIGCVRDANRSKDFVMDRLNGIVYFQGEQFSSMPLVGITGGKVVYVCFAGNSLPFFPDDVRRQAESGCDVLVVVDMKKLSSLTDR